ncbi:MAG: methyltransferase domain-containing protein [Leptospirillia bacterium]
METPGELIPPLDSDWWNARYREGDTGWDLGQPSPPFVALHRQGVIRPCRVAVPGAGTGWEAVWLAEQGYEVTAIDFAPAALARIRERAAGQGVSLNLVQEDVLAPPEALWGRFDLVLEQTCFCAIHPARRSEYVAGISRLLVPGGRLVGLFYACAGDGGPPFSVTPEAVRELFKQNFTIESLAITPDSHERRQGEEWLGMLRRP